MVINFIHYQSKWFDNHWLLFFILNGLVFPLTVTATSITDIQRGQQAFEAGAYEQAIDYWENALKQDYPLSAPQSIDVLTHLAVAYQTVGHYHLAKTILEQALSLSDDSGNLNQRILVRSHLGDVLLAMHEPEIAEQYLVEGLTLAQSSDNPQLLAHLQNNLGNVFSVEQKYSKALAAFTEAAQFAERYNDGLLQVQAQLNKAKTLFKQNNTTHFMTLLETIQSQVHQFPNDRTKGFQLLSLGQLALKLHKQSPTISHGRSITLFAYNNLNHAFQLAEQLQEKRLMAYAKGYLGELYEQAQRYREALQLTHEAIFLSQEMPDILYRWEWQQGRLWQAQQQLNEAKASYQRALEQLQTIRTGLVTGQRDSQEVFYERIRPVYFSLADILLQQAKTTSSPTEKAKRLNQARKTVEQLKAAELQNYFQDECVSKIEITPLDQLDQKTAVLYPVLLPDRTELLLSLPSGIQQFVIPVTGETLSQTVIDFQHHLQVRTNFRFILQSQKLYNWLIAPIEAQLINSNINTIVIVPDGPLRMIPIAALHDGQQFLIERFALATTPGLDLTEPRPLPRENVSVLLNGLSQGVQNFSPLPNVPKEINNISALFSNHSILINQSFLLRKVRQALQKNPYSIVHIASHGQFNRDPKKTFVLTFDDKLTMDRLEKLLAFSEFRKEPVELLTLSACQTAVGDERAALGLAGIAIKAGARSALASLWFVNDEATSELITAFYNQLKNKSLSKAQALRAAQRKLLKMHSFRHPAFWSPFLLIGNWL